jgi:Domain of unknown function (DUF4360)
MKGKYLCLLCIILLSASITYADNSTLQVNQVFAASGAGPYLETPEYNGSGCPSGTVSTALSPDKTALSVLFDGYKVEAGVGKTLTDSRKECSIAIPFFVPLGYQVAIVGADYRGFNDLPLGGRAQFTAEYFLAGENTLPSTTTFDGPVSTNFLLQDSVHTDAVRWSDCSTPVIFRINTDLVVHSNSNDDEAMSTIDSADLTIIEPNNPNALQFYFIYQPCSSHSRGGSTT